jgi:hypothetical protein
MKLLPCVALIAQISGKESFPTREKPFLLLQQLFLHKAFREQQRIYRYQ